MRLSGRRVLITGAGGGIGAALARGMAREGAVIALHGRRAGPLREVAESIESEGGAAICVTGDVSDEREAIGIVEQSCSLLGGIDVLVNNAGIMSTTPFLELTADEWRSVIDTNLTGYFLMGQAAARSMVNAGGGVILNVSSTRQTQAWAGSSAYAASKGGIAMLTRCMALELATRGVRVNSIAPGTFVTDLNRSYLLDPEFRRKREESIPLGRYGELEELVGAAVYLCSDEATYVTGASLMVDGGQTLG